MSLRVQRAAWTALIVLSLSCGTSDAANPDERALHRLRDGLTVTLVAMEAAPAIFPLTKLEKPRVLALEARSEARRVWVAFYDRLLALRGISEAYRGVSRGSNAFALHHAASVAHYRFSLDFIERIERDPGLDDVLNEEDPSLGLPPETYTALKNDILNVFRAGSFASKRAIDRIAVEVSSERLATSIRADAKRIWKMGQGVGPLLTAKHVAKRAGGAATGAVLPVQERVARGLAEVRVRRGDSALISEAQIDALRGRLEPGDIFLTRREWYASNLGIPGFWSHAALYIGSAADRRAFFEDEAVANWVRHQGEDSGSLEALLGSTTSRSAGAPVLEAVAEGVVFVSLKKAAHADSIAVLRPILPKVVKARAVWRAFQYAGRPYDYNFDFRSDDALVCSELVYKAYRELPGEAGLELPLSRTLGRPMMSPNELARLYDQDNRDRFALVAFLDGDERAGTASEADEQRFRTSWSRPKWHILLPADSGP